MANLVANSGLYIQEILKQICVSLLSSSRETETQKEEFYAENNRNFGRNPLHLSNLEGSSPILASDKLLQTFVQRMRAGFCPPWWLQQAKPVSVLMWESDIWKIVTHPLRCWPCDCIITCHGLSPGRGLCFMSAHISFSLNSSLLQKGLFFVI